MLCVKCGHEISTEHTINFCPNCGQPIKEENKIARYTTDGKPISQPKSQEGIPSSAPTTDSKINTETPKAKGIAEPINYNTKYINQPSSGHGKAVGALIAIVIIAIIIAVVVNYIYQTGCQTDKLLELGCTPEA